MSAAPSGRIQPSQSFNPTSYGSIPPSTSLLERTTASSFTDPHSVSEHDSVRSESELSNDQDENGSMYEEDDWGGGSVVSEFVQMFHPNEYVVAQQRLGSDFGSYDEERMSGVHSSYGSRWSNRRPSAVSSLRPSLLSRRARQMPELEEEHHQPQSQQSGLLPSGSSWSKPSTSLGPDLTSTISLRQALSNPSTTPGSNLGLMLIAVSQIAYSTMNMFVKLLDERPPSPTTPRIGALEIVGVECLIIWIGCVLAMGVAGTEDILLGPRGTRQLLLARGMFGFTSTLALYLSLQALSLSDATVITFLAPLATGFLAYIVLDEPFTLPERIAGIVSLSGVTLIARPSFLFGPNTGVGIPEDGDVPPPPPSPTPPSETGRIIGIIIALLGVLLMASAWVCLRKIGKRASTYHSIAYFSLCSWVSSFVCMAILRQPFVIPREVSSMMLLGGVGVFSLVAQVFQTLGLQRESAGRAATMSYLQIIFALSWQLGLFGEWPDSVSILGSLIILASGAWVALANPASTPLH